MDLKNESKANETKAKETAVRIKPENRLMYPCFKIEVNGDEVVGFADNGRLVLARRDECVIHEAKSGALAQLECDRTKIVVQ